MNKNTKIIIAVAVGVVALIVVFGIVVLRKPAPVEVKKTSQLLESQDDTEPIPTVGPEVKVKLVSVQPKKEVKLVVEGVPAKTTTIEYEFTYSTKEQESEGVFSTARPKEGESSFPKTFERQITLGTCSKNVCRYHNITSDVVIRLKFEGEYGSQLFQKEFPSSDL
jgi:hypothetical protein